MYLNGQGVRQAYDASAHWLHQAADQGHALAQRNLALLYFKGQGVPRNHAATVEWLNRAAVQGCVLAQKDLARVHLKGDGVQNPTAAVSWLQRLAEGGHRDEQYYLGLMYYDGRGVSCDPAVAAMWFRRAADRWHHEAEYRLGLMSRDGTGVPQDLGIAAGWLRRAAACGHAKARFVRDRIRRAAPVHRRAFWDGPDDKKQAPLLVRTDTHVGRVFPPRGSEIAFMQAHRPPVSGRPDRLFAARRPRRPCAG